MLVAEETASMCYFSPPEEISSRLDMTFSCKQNLNSKRCLFAILLILIWGLKKRTQQNKGTLILEVEVPAAH